MGRTQSSAHRRPRSACPASVRTEPEPPVPRPRTRTQPSTAELDCSYFAPVFSWFTAGLRRSCGLRPSLLAHLSFTRVPDDRPQASFTILARGVENATLPAALAKGIKANL